MASNANRWVCPLLVSLASFYVTGSAAAEDKPKFVIVTEGKQLGIKEGDTFYPLGMANGKFEEKFGQPDKSVKTTTEYLGEGLEVVHKDGVVGSFIFYTKDFDGSGVGGGKFKAADVKTDKGITGASTYRELVKAHGAPTKTYDIGALNVMIYEYTWGMINTKNGEITSIRVGGR